MAYKQAAYLWRGEDPEFEDQWDEAIEAAADVLEAEARRRAVDGIEVRHYDRDGKLVSTEHKYSDTLLIFLLKGVRPNKYRDNATLGHEFQGPRLLVGPRKRPPALEPPSN